MAVILTGKPVADALSADTARRAGIDNSPQTFQQVAHLSGLGCHLDRIRTIKGCSIRVNSAFRTPQLNARLKGSAPRSYHLQGRAADIVAANLPRLKDVVLRYCGFQPAPGLTHYEDARFEVILYPTFLHFAYKGPVEEA